ISLAPNVSGTQDLQHLCESCTLIFQVTPSIHFRQVIRRMAPFLGPEHIIIHGTKGFDLLQDEYDAMFTYDDFTLSDVKTMSQVILEETDVARFGALCGPNLSSEILAGLPTATVIASEYDEVIRAGHKAISGKAFFVFGSHDVKAAELAGALKNIIAIASGMLGGKRMGKNTEAMLIIRGLREMILLGEVMGSNSRSFYGTPGLGDLIATATSTDSRNYSCGRQIAEGRTVQEIMESSQEVIEGIRSVRIANHLIKSLRLRAPIISMIYAVLFENKGIEESVFDLMKYPLISDVDFMK
ncbi:MAG: NAD(P)H-dependent glycerol-3-phosphate dehydrogenase, partial [Bacteroidota bacterium]